jgi:hypothetical protein
LGRQGWVEIVRKHIERDPLAVHQRGWIGDTPLHWPKQELAARSRESTCSFFAIQTRRVRGKFMRQVPASVTVIAVLHFIFGGVGLLGDVCSGGMLIAATHASTA